jgi:hypothetical protein
MFRPFFTSVIPLILTMLPGRLWAQSPQQVFAQQFSSHRLEMPAEDAAILNSGSGRYPEPLNWLFESVLRWVPKGEPKKLNVTCDRDLWTERLFDSRLQQAVNLQGALIQKYFQDCEKELETGHSSEFVNVVKMLTMKFNVQEHPFLRRVVLHLPGNVKVKAVLALKGDLRARPFVVIRMGVFANAESFKPERPWLMMMFEQSPFNVLVVENMTSSEFVQNNSKLSLGGYDEGLQNLHIARLLTNPEEPISRLVDSVHMFGISLGGHGVLFASLLNKYNSTIKKPLIRSFTALCPVIDLRSTMQALTQQGTFSAAADLWGRNRLQGIEERLPQVKDYKAFGFLDKALAEMVRTYNGGLSYNSTVKLPPGMVDGPNFWELNNFWKYYQHVQEPVVIYATPRDPVVPFKLNSQMLQNKSIRVESQNINVIEISQGLHCSLSIPYDWAALTSVLSSFVLSHSPNFKMQEQVIPIPLQGEDWNQVKGEEILGFHVQKPDSEARFAKISIDIKDSQGKVQTLTWNMSLESLDFNFLNSKVSDSESEMIVRWLNQNMRVRLKSGGRNLVLSWKTAL